MNPGEADAMYIIFRDRFIAEFKERVRRKAGTTPGAASMLMILYEWECSLIIARSLQANFEVSEAAKLVP